MHAPSAPPSPNGHVDLAQLAGSLQAHLSTAEAALFAGVQPETVRQWKARGHLAPASYGERGRPLYLGIDVLRAEAKTRAAARRQPIPFQQDGASYSGVA